MFSGRCFGFSKFINQLQSKTKVFVRKLEMILIKLYRQNVSSLFNQTCSYICLCMYVCMYVCVCACVRACVMIRIYICVCVSFFYIYIYIYNYFVICLKHCTNYFIFVLH